MRAGLARARVVAAVVAAGVVLVASGCGSGGAPPAHSSHESAGASPGAKGARFAELAGAYKVQTGVSLPARADALARRMCRPESMVATRLLYRVSYKAVRRGNPSKYAYFIVDAIDAYCPGVVR